MTYANFLDMEGLLETAKEAVRRADWQLGDSLDDLVIPIVKAVLKDREEMGPGEELQKAIQELRREHDVEKVLPNEIAHSQGWVGALDLMAEIVQKTTGVSTLRK
jgi:hypothetical protein